MRFEAGTWTRLAVPDGALAFVEDEGTVLMHVSDGHWCPLASVLRVLEHFPSRRSRRGESRGGASRIQGVCW